MALESSGRCSGYNLNYSKVTFTPTLAVTPGGTAPSGTLNEEPILFGLVPLYFLRLVTPTTEVTVSTVHSVSTPRRSNLHQCVVQTDAALCTGMAIPGVYRQDGLLWTAAVACCTDLITFDSCKYSQLVSSSCAAAAAAGPLKELAVLAILLFSMVNYTDTCGPVTG